MSEAETTLACIVGCLRSVGVVTTYPANHLPEKYLKAEQRLWSLTVLIGPRTIAFHVVYFQFDFIECCWFWRWSGIFTFFHDHTSTRSYLVNRRELRVVMRLSALLSTVLAIHLIGLCCGTGMCSSTSSSTYVTYLQLQVTVTSCSCTCTCSSTRTCTCSSTRTCTCTCTQKTSLLSSLLDWFRLYSSLG